MATKSNSRTRSAGSSSSSPPAKRQKTTVAPFAASFPRRTILSSSRWVNKIPHDIWVYKILNPFLDLKALATVGRGNTFFQEYWQYVLKQNVIRVPEGCPTIDQAMELAVVFSERNKCTRVNPVKIQLGKGVHEIVGDQLGLIDVTCNHIAFVGSGKDQTTIRGGFKIYNQQLVKFEELTITNPRQGGFGLWLLGLTNVDVVKCAVKECASCGIKVHYSTITLTQCEIMENGNAGVYCHGETKARLNDCKMYHNQKEGLVAITDATVVDLHGTKTDIHSNKRCGIRACFCGKVNIHLPTQHNTSHGNVKMDRYEYRGGSIANINADGTFTHVDEV